MTIDQQIAEIKRELALRKNVYGKFVASGKMKQSQADHCTAALTAALHTVMAVKRLRATMVEHHYRATGACDCGWTAEHMTDGFAAWLDHVFERSKAAEETQP